MVSFEMVPVLPDAGIERFLGETCVPWIVSELDDDDFEVRERATRALDSSSSP